MRASIYIEVDISIEDTPYILMFYIQFLLITLIIRIRVQMFAYAWLVNEIH